MTEPTEEKAAEAFWPAWDKVSDVLLYLCSKNHFVFSYFNRTHEETFSMYLFVSNAEVHFGFGA